MKDYIDLGPAPVAENCKQCGDDGAREECDRYRDMCREIYPQAEEFGVYFTTKANAHDYGTYYEVNAVVKDDSREESISYAYWCQDNQPERWTDTEERIYTPTEDEQDNTDGPYGTRRIEDAICEELTTDRGEW